MTDPSRLPPPDDLRNLSLETLIEILGSRLPLHEAVARAKQRGAVVGPDGTDIPIEIDPLGRVQTILADEVGMGKTFVALAVAASVALARPDDGPIVVMVPPSLKHKWPKDWDVFREHCLRGEPQKTLKADSADSGVAFLRLLDDPRASRKAIIFLTHGALNRSLTDEWVKLALIRRALARRTSMEHVRRALPRFAGSLLRSQWVDHHAPDLSARLLDRPPHQWLRIMKSALAERAPDDEPVPAALEKALDDPDLDFEPMLTALDALPLRKSAHLWPG